MADKRIYELTTTATEADLVAGKYFVMDGQSGLTPKLPANLVAPRSGSTDEVHNLPTTATESDLVAGNYSALDGNEGTKKLPANLLSSSNRLLASSILEKQYLNTITKKYHLIRGVVNPDTGAFESSTTRVRSDYIDVYSFEKILNPGQNSWIRCYDKDKTYLGVPRGYGSVQVDFYSDYILAYFHTAQYVVFVSTGTAETDVDVNYYAAPDSSFFKETDIATKTFPLIQCGISEKVLPVQFKTFDLETEQFVASYERNSTGYIQINDFVTLSVDNGKYFWIRCFNQSKEYIGTPSGAAYVKDVEITSDYIKNALPDTEYVAVVATHTDGDLLVERVVSKYKSSLNSFASVKNAALIDGVPYGACNPAESAIQNALGSVDNTTGELVDSTNRVRTDYIEVGSFGKISIETGIIFWVRCYDENKNFLGTMPGYGYVQDKDIFSENAKSSFPNNSLKYFIIVAIASAPIAMTKYDKAGLKDDFSLISFLNKNCREKTEEIEKFWYDVGDDNCTTGQLMLPSNYSSYGKPVPLIVFCQGSGNYNRINDPMVTEATYLNYYRYLRDCGFAIFSCYGWGNKYINQGVFTSDKYAVGTWNAPTNKRCWETGIKFVLDHYNVSKDNIFVTAKSQGGTQAFPLFFSSQFNIRAAGLLAPASSVLQANFGYCTGGDVFNTRKLYLDELGIDYTGESWIDKAPSDFTDTDYTNYISFCENNCKKFCGWDGYYFGFEGLSTVQLTDKIITNKSGLNVDDYKRFSHFGKPVKIWVADDDVNISPILLKGMVKSLIQGGCVASIRQMPDGTGGHHSVDSDPNAPQTTNVTTRLGIHYDSVPTAYYELSQFFISNEV